MEDQTAINPCWTNPELDAIRSRIKELRDAHRSSDDAPELSPSDSEQLLKDCARQLESTVNEVLSQFSDVGSLTIADLDAYSARLKEELNNVEDENAKISSEIGDLMRTYKEDSSRLEIELEGLDSSLDYIASKGVDNAKADGYVDSTARGEVDLLDVKSDYKFEMLGFSHQIENKKMILKSLQGLDCVLKRFEAIDKIEDTLTGLQVIEYEGNCIRLLLKTFVPDSLLSQHMIEDVAEPLQHELKIEVAEGKLEIKSVEISPNDVYIDEVIDTAKSDGQFFNMSIMKLRSSLEWFVRRVQDRIVLCRLRQLLVKFANKSRHFFEYFDRDEIIVAHMVGGIDAYIKMSHDWPLANHALWLISLKSSTHYSKAISTSFISKVQEVANSLDAHIRQNISSFVDAIEELLRQQTAS